jgi:prepilin-type N-terminal cleavage/methylation domain-containing protein
MCYGFTLLEVMISMLLLAMAMLAMDVMAVQSLHESQKNYLFSVALNEMASMSERLQVWQNPADLSARWNNELKNLLPLAQGQVNGVFPDYTITLCWSKSECLANTVHVD